MPSWRDRSPGDTATSTSTNPDPQWWRTFHDGKLTDLIDTAISGNLDLQQAMLRVVVSREAVITARAAGLPTLNATGLYSRLQPGLRGALESRVSTGN